MLFTFGFVNCKDGGLENFSGVNSRGGWGLGGWSFGALGYYLLGYVIIRGVFGTNSSFRVKQRTTGKV